MLDGGAQPWNAEGGVATCTDSAAAVGKYHKAGPGRSKHMEVKKFGIQKVVAQGGVKVLQAPLQANPGYIMTHSAPGKIWIST